MNIFTRFLHPLLAAMLVAGCADGLVYGERTSFDLASVRLNDDPSEPVSVKLGFNRSVAMAAPAIGGRVEDVERKANGNEIRRVTPEGESVSHFSSFTLKSVPPFVRSTSGEQEALLDVQTRFASGQAAIAIADNPQVVAALMGLRPLPLRDQETAALVQSLSACVNAMDRRQLDDLADGLGITLTSAELGNDQEAKRRITEFIDQEEDAAALERYRAISGCPS